MRPPTHAPSSFVFSCLLTLCTLGQGCWDSATSCQNDTDCFVGEQCIQQVCSSSKGPDARPDIASDQPTDQPTDQPSGLCDLIDCAAGFVCDPADGACVCAPGTHECGGQCVDDSSPLTCGQRCSPCEGADEDRAGCVDGMCVETCGAGTLICDGACAQCPDADNGALGCQGGECVLTACDADFLLCEKSCQKCPQMNQPNAKVECSDGDACEVTCDDDAKLCGDTCATCPTGDAVLATECTPQGTCVASDCARGSQPCPQGCCVPGVAPSGPIPGITDTLSDLELYDGDDPLIVHSTPLGTGMVSATTWSGTQWVTQSIAQGRIDGPGSVVLDNAQRPHVVYLNHATRRLHHATFVNNTWVSSILEVLPNQDLNKVNWKVAYHRNAVHVVLAQNSKVSYITGNSNAWTNETVSTNAGTHRAASIAFASLQGGAHIAVKPNALPMQLFERQNNGAWSSSPIADDTSAVLPEHSVLFTNSLTGLNLTLLVDDNTSRSLGLFQSRAVVIGSPTWMYYPFGSAISNGDLAQSGLGHAFLEASAFGSELSVVFTDEISGEVKYAAVNSMAGMTSMRVISPTVANTRADMARGRRTSLAFSLVTLVGGTPTLTYIAP